MVSLNQIILKGIFVFYFLLFTAVGTVILVFAFGLQIEWQLLYTLWVAEVPIAVLLRYLLGEGTHDRPKLRIERSIAREEGGMKYGVLEVRNTGEVTAESCRATLTMRNVTASDLLKPDAQTLVDAGNWPLEELVLPWVNASEEPSIRPDDRAFVDFMRAVADNGQVFFELPSKDGWKKPLCALRIRSYQGIIKVGAEKGRPAKGRLGVSHNKRTGTWRIRVIPLWP
jgi:hypothetical protein